MSLSFFLGCHVLQSVFRHSCGSQHQLKTTANLSQFLLYIVLRYTEYETTIFGSPALVLGCASGGALVVGLSSGGLLACSVTNLMFLPHSCSTEWTVEWTGDYLIGEVTSESVDIFFNISLSVN